MGTAGLPRRTLTREQRDCLWREGRYELELETHADSGREQLLAEARQVEDFVALYDDLGWDEADDRQSYTLTMPDEQLRRIGERLRETACSLLRDDVAGPFGGRREYVDEDLDLLHASRLILGEVG